MQFSEAWLRCLVNPALDVRQLGHLLTMAGLEVEAVEPVAAPFTRVVVGEILAAEKHPNADRLQICRVHVGDAEPLTIVCGAPNARPGLKTACALIGAVLPGDFQIRQAKVRGVLSHGMLCSAKELGISADASGILELATDAPVGAGLRDWLGLDDHLLTLKLTPNRGDCLSLQGIAREVAALTDSPMTPVDCSPVTATLEDVFPVHIYAETACPRYCGRVIRGIDAKAVTPVWMVRRLERSGLRSIHPVVDVTNYVLLELGQPMHGFDLARLRGSLRVRMAHVGEALTLLSGQAIALKDHSLVIADDSGPLALAGIMGGEGSGVTQDSRDVFLEAAHFTPEALAGRARGYALSTDSSHRFERGVDPELPMQAMQRATRLILDICGGRAGPVTMAGPGAPTRKSIRFRPGRARRLLGFDLEDGHMRDILSRLGMTTQPMPEGMRVTVPSHRFDINQEVDLIEEIARVHGYDDIPAADPRGIHVMLPAGERIRPAKEIRNILTSRGYQEVVTYSFISDELDADFRDEGGAISLLNPIASQMGVMRGSLLAGLLQTLRHNLNHGQERLRLFELGRVFIRTGAEEQPLRAAGLAYGTALPEQWGDKARSLDFYDLRADLEALFHPTRANFTSGRHPALHPGQCAQIDVHGTRVGWLGALHPALRQKYGLNRPPYLFEVDLGALMQRPMPGHAGVSRLPAVRRDIAVVVDEDVPAGALLAAVNSRKPGLVAEFSLFDIYQGKGVMDGKKSLAFKMLVQHTEKTLTDSEIDAAVLDVLQILKNDFDASLRS
ncbi:MAG TPA: phenylalanine--tRNA ligase subunit beta [Thiobacillaceae bacterium]|nr:phenylalanine--tRNA ligase subunit beta [Thiobacillaceae bacterium]HNU65325.1 phenylalanine--tRNA ligase subunit beta [Thiobacillaceae bacterium]